MATQRAQTATTRDGESQRLAARFVRDVQEKGKRIVSLWDRAGATGGASKYLQALILDCHNLAGSAGSYGLNDLAEIARNIERGARALEGQTGAELATQIQTISKHIRALERSISGVSEEMVRKHLEHASKDVPIVEQSGMPLVFIVDDDAIQGERLALQLESHGFKTRTFVSLDDLREAVLAHAPHAIVADVVFPEGQTAGIEAIAALRQLSRKPLQVIFISSRGDANARLQALRAGGSGYFTKPIQLPALAAKLHQLTQQQAGEPYRVMIVDDDVSSSKIHAAILKKAGFEVRVVNHPLAVIQEAMEFDPELIFLDLYMPEADGLEIATMLRQEERFLEVPIVFLSGENDEAIKERAIKKGAASFLNKPVSHTHLVSQAEALTQRYRSQAAKSSYLGRIDAVTGLFTRDYLFSKLEAYCHRYDKKDKKIAALLMIEIDGYAYFLRTLGEEHMRLLNARIAQLIRTELEADDIAGSYTNSSFLIFAIRPNLNALSRFAEALHARITQQPLNILGHEHQLAVSIGVSKASRSNQNQVLAEAALACSLAQKEGGNRVLLHSDLQKEVCEDHQIRFLRRQIKYALRHRKIGLEFSPIMGISVEEHQRFSVFACLYDEQGKSLLPQQYIPVARKFGMLPALERWTVMTILRELSRAQRKHERTSYFIRLSRDTVLDVEFTQWLKRALKKFPVRTNTCIFEIAEDDLTGNLPRIQNFVIAVKQLGCCLALSDFGRDPNALQLAESVHPDYLRLAPALVEDLYRESRKQEALQELCRQAHALKAQVLVAYIQNAQTLSYLWRLGVDFIQGDFLEQGEKPMLELELVEDV